MFCMKKIILILVLLMFTNVVQARPNYTYTLDDTNNTTQQQTYTKSDFKIGGGVTGGKGYVKLKYKNKQVVKLSTKTINNNLLKFVNISI